MSFSIEEKVDLLLKKVAFGKTKTDTSENRDGFGESIASPLLLRGDKVWKDAGSIPATPPSTTTSIVGVYTGSAVVECEAASTSTDTNISQFKRAWQCVDGSSNPLTDWIPSEFSGLYTVELYVGPSGWNGEDATATSIGGTNGSGTGASVFRVNPGVASATWFFDYQAGILYWANEDETGTLGGSEALTSSIAGTDVVYIKGYRYVGGFGVGSALAAATDSVLGGLKFPDATTQTTAAESVSTTSNRTYGIQFNGNGQAVVNVPWVDTNTTDHDAVSSTESNAVSFVSFNSGTQAFTFDQVDLETDVTGTLPVANGGTGLTAITSLLNSNTSANDVGLDQVENAAASGLYVALAGGSTIAGATPLIFEGATDNVYETSLAVTDPTADRTITLPNATGTVALLENDLGDFATTTSSALASVISDGTGTGSLVFSLSPSFTGTVTAADVSITGSLTVQGDFVSTTSTVVQFEDTYLDLNVSGTGNNDYTTNSGLHFGRSTGAADTLDGYAAFHYDGTNDVFKFTRYTDSTTGAIASADNVKSLKFTKSDTVSPTSQGNGDNSSTDTEYANESSTRSLGAVAKCRITISTWATDGGSSENYAPEIGALNGYVVQHNLNTQSVYVVAIKDPLNTPIPVYCKYEIIDGDSIRVTVGQTTENEVYDIIVIG